MRVIGIAGRKGAGKDMAAKALIDVCGAKRFAFADPLKSGVREMFGLTHEHTDGKLKEEVIPWLGVTPRHLLQTGGTEWARKMIREDVWALVASRFLERMREDGVEMVVIPDVRFHPQETSMIRGFGGEIWRVTRPELEPTGIKAFLVKHAWPVYRRFVHQSEWGIPDDLVDVELLNDGSIRKLRERVLGVVEERFPGAGPRESGEEPWPDLHAEITGVVRRSSAERDVGVGQGGPGPR